MRHQATLVWILWVLSACQLKPSGQSPTTPGTDFGSGSEKFEKNAHTHWFASFQKPVSYCLTIGDNSSFNAEAVHSLIQKAFQKWEDYIAKKGLPKSVFSISLKQNSICEQNTNIQFLWGASTKEVEKLKTDYESPLGFAHFQRNEGTGVVWINEPEIVSLKSNQTAAATTQSKVEDRLFAILLHEVGHIYGNGHIPNTIMRQHLARDVFALTQRELNNIDHEGVVASCFDCEWACQSESSQNTLKLSRLPKHHPLMALNKWSSLLFRLESETLLELTQGIQSDSYWSLGLEEVVTFPSEQLAFAIATTDGPRGWASQGTLTIHFRNKDGKQLTGVLLESDDKIRVSIIGIGSKLESFSCHYE